MSTILDFLNIISGAKYGRDVRQAMKEYWLRQGVVMKPPKDLLWHIEPPAGQHPISFDAYIPMGYIPNEFQKLDIYKRIAGIETQEEVDEMLEELIDEIIAKAKSDSKTYLESVKEGSFVVQSREYRISIAKLSNYNKTAPQLWGG